MPDLHQSDIDESTLSQLVTDIGSHTELLGVLPKFGPGYVGEQETLQLDEAYQLLIKREVRGMQLHYRHEGVHWCDTIMPIPDGRFRIVRMEQNTDTPA